jgi:hypothetical protein
LLFGLEWSGSHLQTAPHTAMRTPKIRRQRDQIQPVDVPPQVRA